jgi:hypothetical protein
MKTFNGWQRLGIVISVSWAVFVALSVTWDYVFLNGRDWSYGDIALAVFVPVLLGWFPYAAICAVRWIAAGFVWRAVIVSPFLRGITLMRRRTRQVCRHRRLQ